MHKNFGSYVCSANYLDDLVVNEDDDGWKHSPDEHRWAAHTAHFSFVRDWNNNIVDLTNVDTTPFSSCIFYQNSSWLSRASCEEIECELDHCDDADRVWISHVYKPFNKHRAWNSEATRDMAKLQAENDAMPSHSEKSAGKPKAKAKSVMAKRIAKKQAAARREASTEEKQQYHHEFYRAKLAECASWKENDVYDLVDMRKLDVKNYITGRWVLTVKRDKHGNFDKCKARRVLRGFSRSTSLGITSEISNIDAAWFQTSVPIRS